MSTASARPSGPVAAQVEQEPRGSLGLGTAIALIVGTCEAEAAAQYARASGRTAVIGSLELLSSIPAGHSGTRISVEAEGMETR
jgi:hypothetical protein